MQHIDTLIHAGWVIPVEPENTIYQHHAIAIHDGKIVGILPSNEAVSRFSARITHRLSTHLVIPGLINTHTHAAMTLFRGFADDLPLAEWLNKRIWPAEKACVDQNFVADGTRLAIAEMLRGGVTCFNDMYFFPDVAAEVAESAGIRAMIGLIALDFPTQWAEGIDEYLQKAADVHAQCQDYPLVKTALAPHAPYTLSDLSLEKVQAMAEKMDLPIHMHIHETWGEIEQSVEQYGERPLARLNRLGLLNSHLIAVHMTQVENDEITKLAVNDVHIAHCPESNLKLASGFCPTSKLLRLGVNVALGTDGTASNDDLDMLGEMRTAALLAKGVSKDASSLPAMEALKMATLNGAKALNIDDVTGSLMIGKSADLVALDMMSIETLPTYDPLTQLVYSVGRDKVTDVWVAGKHLLKSRSLTSLDIHDIMAKAHSWREKVLQAIS